MRRSPSVSAAMASASLGTVPGNAERAASDFFAAEITGLLLSIGGGKLQGTYPLELGGNIDGAYKVREKELHGRFGALKLWKCCEERTHQDVAVGIVALEGGITFAGRHFLQLQLHGAHGAFRKVRGIVVFQDPVPDEERWRPFQTMAF